MALMTTVFSSYHFEHLPAYLVLSAPVISRDFHDVYRARHLADPAVIIQRVISEWLRPVLTFCVCLRKAAQPSIPLLAISAR